MSGYLSRCVILTVLLLSVVSAQAGIVLNTTRVIYQGNEKEVSLGVHNSGSGEILLQSWLESPTPESAHQESASHVPFIVTPPLTRMAGGGRQLVRIIYSGADMPKDRESVLWLNVQEIPQAAAVNTLQIAIRQRIKVFFRPDGLVGDPQQAPEKLQWQLSDPDNLSVVNPGPYHVSMLGISLHRQGTELAVIDSQMLAPLQRLTIPLLHNSGTAPWVLKFVSINDYGGQVPYQATLFNQQPGYANKVLSR
ncbi:molecular chaperone [Pseudomonas tremae]|uniref:fimbrial biogenesis chaperone n=1 Tax=Pseudomonas syringae group TaxID=136849 RepID=UPI0002F040FB|nr:MULTISPECIES: molecular chaperone [Pseudomonas syringae group]QGL59690.1 fimbria/pilus periplasmic chaperone [Pseudomonas coronafaciens pv. oryzae str. 1_6]KPB52821.1 Pili assembly chaperone pili assembly chaperone [Pseudomonas coronafaciens pv. oryzae]KPY08856.1 Pili assembly chaperone: pili assembly chaperone [Pseudomonas coronafaciens pv. oryzae]MCF5802595.1 fimbria/pilus periplasmic chaperone [Pseudomonas tremae]MCF5808564.1 fimbria/pilus periplasmic chaperone [Pseudomonas tremae]